MKTSHYLILILALAATLRLSGLTQESFWIDEGATARCAQTSLRGLVHEFRIDTQTALYYFGMNGWCRVFGASEFSLRLPSVLFGIAAVLGVYLFATQIFSPAAGLLSALCMAVNPFAIYYSQEARPYALFLAASVFSIYYLLRAFQRPSRSVAAGYIVSTAATLLAHPLGLLIMPIEGAAWLIWRRVPGYEAARSRPLALLGAAAVAGVAYLPQLLLMWKTVINKVHGNSPSTAWIRVPTLSTLAATVREFFMTPVAAVLVLAIIAALLILRMRRDGADRPGLCLTAVMVAGFMIVPWLASQVTSPVYAHRYVIPALTAFMIALGWAFAKMGIRVRAVLLGVFLLVSVQALYGYYTGRDKEDWRETAAFIARAAKPGDAVVLNPLWIRDAFTYYYHPPAGVCVTAPFNSRDIPPEVDTSARVWLVQSYQDQPAQVTPELLARIARNRTAGERAVAPGLVKPNPYAYWVPDIHITSFVRTVPQSGLP